MPDTRRQNETPRDWTDAFLALPQEAPPADVLRSFTKRLDARDRRRRVPAWLGLAAAAAFVAIALWPRAQVEPTHGPLQSTRIAQLPPAGATEAANATHDKAAPVATPSVTTVAASGAPTMSDVAASGASEGNGRSSTAGAPEVPTAEPAIGRLYTESAQLEAVLAVARDERAGSASAMLLADAFDAQVASIDSSLSDPALDDARRERLWEARVDTLRQAAGFIGTQRLLAAQGQGDALLVSVD